MPAVDPHIGTGQAATTSTPASSLTLGSVIGLPGLDNMDADGTPIPNEPLSISGGVRQNMVPSPIDPASLPPRPLSKANYEAVGARNKYLADLYDPNSWTDRALTLVTGSMSDPANVLTDSERSEHQALNAKILETLCPAPTPDEARVDKMIDSPIGAIASTAVRLSGGSQASQDLALDLGTATQGLGTAYVGVRAGPATQFLGAQVGETVPVGPSRAAATYTNRFPSDTVVSQTAVRPLVQDVSGRRWGCSRAVDNYFRRPVRSTS